MDNTIDEELKEKSTEEQWTEMTEFPKYYISDKGHVKSERTGKILTQIKRDYACVVILYNKVTVHKMVAKYFVPNDDPVNKVRIIHIDKNKFNNNATNLQWDVRKQSKKYKRKIEVKMNQRIIQYDLEMKQIKIWKNIYDIIDAHQYLIYHLYDCMTGKRIDAYGYVWKYEKEPEKKPDVILEKDEFFKDIGIFEGFDLSNYQISCYGKVKNIETGLFLKPKEQINYYLITLYDKNLNTINLHIHKLVAHYFVDKEEDDNAINHLDENTKNNYYKNLEWIYLEDVTKRPTQIYEYYVDPTIIKEEQWVDIEGHKNYQISTNGRVKNIKTGKILYPGLNSKYYSISLSEINDFSRYRIHRLVAKHFIPNDDLNKIIVDHKDNNKLNNYVSNLRWVTYKENRDYYVQGYMESKINEILQYDIKMNLIKEWKNKDEILQANPTYKYSTITSCLNDSKPSAYGHIWKYKNMKEETVLHPDEEFKNLGIYENKDFTEYDISNNGNVYSYPKKRYLALHDANGYNSVSIVDKNSGKSYHILVHILVAHAFIPNDDESKVLVNHIDENKKNNYYKNLEWKTPSGNVNHSLKKRLMLI
ncbi:HNH endonuclease [Klosneuvirus KNV1]|uniref:HNH endonuclease n=1 Tax=Klosneuvirus KNV1 TaxID=1977640 RepID=A0A1V0SHN8_9VIRU|nr:HNH endonuclease [Klosneuvirus KNV1]